MNELPYYYACTYFLHFNSFYDIVFLPYNEQTVTPHSTPDTNANGTEAQRQVPLPKQGTIIQVTKKSQPMLRPYDDMLGLKASNKRKSSSLDDEGHRAKRIKFAAAAASSPAAKSSRSTKRTFASRCA